MPQSLTFRTDNLRDPARRQAWADLLRDIFEVDFTAFLALGIWPAEYRAFSYMEGDVIAANVSLEPLPVMIANRQVSAGQIQSVATRPPYRRRGLFDDLMRQSLAFANTQYECLFLTTSTPDLYHPFGFRPLPQHHFSGRLADDGNSPIPASRLLALDQPDDIAVIRWLFARRSPVSHVFAPCANEGIFIALALLHAEWRLSYLPDHEALIVWQVKNGVTQLLDIVAERIPAGRVLTEVLQISPGSAIEILFSPDRIIGLFAPSPHHFDDGTTIMIRGPFDANGLPSMLPLTAVT